MPSLICKPSMSRRGQLNHRRAALEQRTKLDEALAEQARRQVEIDTVAAARLEVSSRQKKAEADAPARQ